MNNYTFPVGGKITDEQRFLGVGNGFVGAPAVRAELGNDGRRCLHMVVGIGFLEGGVSENGKNRTLSLRRDC